MKIYFLLLSLIHFCTLSLLAQELMMPRISIEAVYKGQMKVAIGAMKSIPPGYIYKTEGYKFQIRLVISLRDISAFNDSLFGIVCILPDYSIKKLYFHSNEIIALTDREYEYSIPIIIKESGWIKIFVASSKDMSTDTDVRFYEQISNQERLFLSPSSE